MRFQNLGKTSQNKNTTPKPHNSTTDVTADDPLCHSCLQHNDRQITHWRSHFRQSPTLLSPLFLKSDTIEAKRGSAGNSARIKNIYLYSGEHRYAVCWFYNSMLHLALHMRCAWAKVSGIIRRSDFPAWSHRVTERQEC